MFMTLNQALAASPVGMAIVEKPYRELVRLCEDGTILGLRVEDQESIIRLTGTAKGLDILNRRFVLENINCRPVYEER